MRIRERTPIWDLTPPPIAGLEPSRRRSSWSTGPWQMLVVIGWVLLLVVLLYALGWR